MLASQVGRLCPASCSFNTAIICSSVNLADFICPFFVRPDSSFIRRKYAVEGHPILKTLRSRRLFEPGGNRRIHAGYGLSSINPENHSNLVLQDTSGFSDCKKRLTAPNAAVRLSAPPQTNVLLLTYDSQIDAKGRIYADGKYLITPALKPTLADSPLCASYATFCAVFLSRTSDSSHSRLATYLSRALAPARSVYL